MSLRLYKNVLNHCQNSAMPNAVQNCTVLSERVDGFAKTSKQASKQVCKKKPIYFCDNLYQEPPSFRSICLVTPWQFCSSLLRQYANNTFEKKQSGMHLMIFLCCITIYGLGPIILFRSSCKHEVSCSSLGRKTDCSYWIYVIWSVLSLLFFYSKSIY